MRGVDLRRTVTVVAVPAALWLLLRGYERKQSHAAGPVDTGPPQMENFEVSGLRWSYEALGTEFRALRDEVLVVKAQIERTYTYLFAIVGAILASQLLSSQVEHRLDHLAWLYLVAALASLWFPVNNILMDVDMAALGSYIREVIAPKMNNLAHVAIAQGVTPGDEAAIAELMGFAENVGRNLSAQQRLHVVYPMAWEEYTGLFRGGRRVRRLILLPLFVVRSAILYAPTVALVLLYFTHIRHVTAIGYALTAVIGLLAIVCLSSFFSVANLVSFGARGGAFKIRKA